MRGLLTIATLSAFSLLPVVVHAQSSPAAIGVGPTGYNFLVGTWSCTNSMPSASNGPANTTLTATRAENAPSGVIARLRGRGFDATGYITLDPKTSTWWNPVSSGTGASLESTRQTGMNMVWVGTAMSPAGTVRIRDLYTITSLNKYIDTTQLETNGNWRIVSKITCTKR